MTIYVNGKPTFLENIFDKIKPENPNYWHKATEKDTGRPINEILTEWSNTNKTWYFLNGEKIIFELK